MSDINSIRKIFNSSISFDKYGIGRPNEFMNAIILLLEVIENIQNNCDCFSFDDIIISLLEGTNINFDIDNINKTITINSSGGSIGIEIDENAFDGDGSIGSPYTLINYADGKQYANVDGAWVEIVAGGLNSIVAGTNITVDNTDPANPIVSASGSGGSACGCAENVSCLVELPESEPCIPCGAENISCLINLM